MRFLPVRSSLLAALAMSGSVAAQDAPAPRGLESFSLPGATPAPSTPEAVPTPAAPVGLPAAAPTPRSPRRAPIVRETPVARETPSAQTRASPGPRVVETPVAAGAIAAESRATPSPVAMPTPAPVATVAAGTVSPEVATGDDGSSRSALIVGVVVVLSIIGLLLWRRRKAGDRVDAQDETIAPEPGAVTVPVVSPTPATSIETAPLAPALPTPRPWIGVTVVPLRAGVNLATATADVDVIVTNVGDAPANTVRVGVSLLSARSGQDDELGRLFAQPIVRPAIAPFALAPGETRTMRLLVTLPRSVLNVLDAGGRPMFVPVVAANVVYDRGDGGAGQTAAAFVIGIDRPGATKLGPFWLDTPGRMHETLGIRPHALSLRS